MRQAVSLLTLICLANSLADIPFLGTVN